jgi:hypothetical protein
VPSDYAPISDQLNILSYIDPLLCRFPYPHKIPADLPASVMLLYGWT